MSNQNIGGAFGGVPTMPNDNPLDDPSETCECGNEIFTPGIIFKKVPGVMLGQGSEYVPVPIKVFVCSKCGKLSPSDQKILDNAKNVQEQATKSNLIL